MHPKVKQSRIRAAQQRLQRARAEFLRDRNSRDHATRKAAQEAYIAAAAQVRREMYR